MILSFEYNKPDRVSGWNEWTKVRLDYLSKEEAETLANKLRHYCTVRRYEDVINKGGKDILMVDGYAITPGMCGVRNVELIEIPRRKKPYVGFFDLTPFEEEWQRRPFLCTNKDYDGLCEAMTHSR